MVSVVPRRRRLGTLVVLLVAAVVVLGAAPRAADARVTRREQMLALINEARADLGMPELSLSTRLSRTAKRHSWQMADDGYIYHTPDLARVLRPYDWSIGGENVGAGFSVETLHRAFMKSAPHRDNVLRRTFDHAGIGFVRQDGVLWVTVVFYG